ncbi:MAG: flagellar hook-associated protein FlgK [Oceanospirillaceae bacterium]|nr:flagellar hook-associated protein FlgK [Oceanospirillaceae bacterium]|tara:strand:- start:1064 stop:4045 length:2982 start_codon:yes stop_codon:yes gene_type:complete
MGNILDIGISGLRAHQKALSVTGNNITNAGVEGYSRQEVTFSENDAQYLGGTWVGSGVNVDSVRRVYDQFITEQLRKDTSSFFQYSAMASNAGQIDSLLADTGTGIQPGLESMFSALQAAVDDPSSLPAREVLISESNALTDRFSLISDRLYEQNEVINGQMEVIASQITTIARSLADLNEEIQIATASASGNEPSTMLDQRDRLLQELSEYVDVTVIEQDENVFNVLIGNGQALVVGNAYNEMFTAEGANDPQRSDIYFRTGDATLNVTNEIEGGQLGGILDFRDSVLDRSLNELGRLSLVIAQSMNDQHKLGIDYDGLKGGNFFEGINDSPKPYQRVLGDSGNANPDDRLIGVYIEDASVLTTSDYKITFPGPDDYTYRVIRESDNKLMETNSLSGVFPDSIRVDGMEIRFEDGSFQQGDEFLVTPTRNAARDLAMYVTRAEQVALASPISTDSAIGNIGSGMIDPGEVYDVTTPYFSEEGSLTPPLIIRFTSPTTYDVLDNTDPGNPIPLFPPLMNQKFTPGISNRILPESEGKTAFTSFGGVLPVQATYQAPAPAALVESQNGFFPERIQITYTNPDTGMKATQPTLITSANASAREIAQQLSLRQGVEATARTVAEISDLKTDPNGFMDTTFTLNGIVLTDSLGPNQSKYDSDYPQDVPSPIDTDFLAARINANRELQSQGIIARSDGAKLTIIDLEGDDLDFEIKGDKGDSFTLGNGTETAVAETGNAPETALNEYEGYDFSEGGPYAYAFDVPGQGSFSFEMTDEYATGEDMIEGFRQAIDDSGYVYSGELDIGFDERGNLHFQPRLEVTGTGPNGSNKVTMGGQLKVIMDENYSMTVEPPGNNLFETNPVGEDVHFGFQVNIDGNPESGDKFTVNYNLDGTSDSRNGVGMAALQSTDTVGGKSTFSESYARLVEIVGAETSRAQINRDSSEILMQNAQNEVNAVSGVNLDEEAAALIQYELAYNASAQVIQVAQDIFDTLIGTFR